MDRIDRRRTLERHPKGCIFYKESLLGVFYCAPHAGCGRIGVVIMYRKAVAMNGKRIIAVALMAALCLTGITVIPAEKVKASTNITYMDAVVDPDTHKVTYTEATASCTEIKDLQDKTAWGTAGETTWYTASADLQIDERVTVSGTVNLILCDWKFLTAKKGITVQDDNDNPNDGSPNALNIYDQSDGTGVLNAGTSDEDETSAPYGCAGIGSKSNYDDTDNERNAGSITINGGTVIVCGGKFAAGIGGGEGSSGGTTVINGGNVEVRTDDGAGIGGGFNGSGGSVEINGGSISSISNLGAGIGGGYNGSGGNVTINGGYVEANGRNGAEGIGRGTGDNDSGTLKLGEGVVCYDADTMTALQPDDNGYIGERTQNMKTVYVPEEPPIFADYTCKVDGKVKIPVGKKVKKVTVEDETIASAKKKGKKVIVYGKAPGTVNVTAYGKKNKVLGNWIVKVE